MNANTSGRIRARSRADHRLRALTIGTAVLGGGSAAANYALDSTPVDYNKERIKSLLQLAGIGLLGVSVVFVGAYLTFGSNSAAIARKTRR